MNDVNQPIEKIILNRKSKLKKLEALNIDSYPNKFDYTHKTCDVNRDFSKLNPGDKSEENISVCGRLISRREMGKSTFGHIFDSTGKLQIYLRQNVVGENSFKTFIDMVDIGDFIGVEGTPFKTKTGELTVNAVRWCLLSKSLRPLPEKWHGLQDVETRYRQRYLDLIANENTRKIFYTRAKIITLIRQFLDKNNFLELETPVIQSMPGGALAKPFKTYHNAYRMDLFLRIAPELPLKISTIGGFDRIYELGRNFRNEGIDRLHSPEFTMLEVYQTYADYNDMLKLCKEIISFVIKELGLQEEIEYGSHKLNLSEYKVISLEELFRKMLGLDLKETLEKNEIRKVAKKLNIEVSNDSSDKKVFDSIFESRIQCELKNPTFVIDYPVIFCPLAKRKKDNPFYAERFELFIGGEEIANAYSELNDPEEQRKRFLAQGEKHDDGENIHPFNEDFITALEYGMPPCGGLGIGIDRLTMFLTNSASIREVILFPLLKPEKT